MSAADVQARVQALIDHRVASGDEVGVQVAVVEHGWVVVDAVSGSADPSQSETVGSDTLFWAASAAKGVASAVAHVLVERGELAYDLRAVEELCDWDHMCTVLAEAEPWWEPGSRFGYHAKTFGFLLGEIVRRATGRTLSWWLREVVTVPLGIGDEVHFGVPEELLDRVVRQQPPIGPPSPAPEPGSPVDRALPPGIRPDADYGNRRDVLTSDIPSEGTMTARGVALIYTALLGDVDGVDLVSPARRASMAAVQFEGQDEVMCIPSRWAFGMVGMNGSAAYADIDSGVAVAVMRSRFDSDLTAVSEIDRSVADVCPPGCSQPDLRRKE
jgi:CubicO group peptidase (beta-lactamase class C family)